MTEGKQGAAEWLRGIIGEYEADGERSCSAMARMFGIDCDYETCRGCMVKMMTAIADRIDADRELPDGVEWPRFEDGGLVRIGDELEFVGKTMLVCDATFYADGWALWCDREDMSGRLYGKYGERVKRPAPKVLDADGVPIKVGDTVWATYGERREHVVKALCSEGFCTVNYEEGGWDYADSVSHEPPDSWEKLEKDAMGRACELAGSGHLRCGDCEWGKEGIGCQAMARLEILKRAKKLAGIEEEEQR